MKRSRSLMHALAFRFGQLLALLAFALPAVLGVVTVIALIWIAVR